MPFIATVLAPARSASAYVQMRRRLASRLGAPTGHHQMLPSAPMPIAELVTLPKASLVQQTEIDTALISSKRACHSICFGFLDTPKFLL